MPTIRQDLGVFGETTVVKNCSCPKCKRSRTLVRLPPNFKCADVICDFCGYLAQSADLQPPELFLMRSPLSANARRAGWQGFNYDVRAVRERFVRLV